jgi:hypothetical protein
VAERSARSPKPTKAAKSAQPAKAVKAPKSTQPVKGTKRAKKATAPERDDRWVFPFEAELHKVAPGLLRSQNAWLSQIDSLPAPDRKTHELIRMVCSVVARNPLGIRRHAMLAAEVGATWEEVAGSVILAEPAFGILVVVEAFPWARKGWERGSNLEDEDEN